ncbi:hypothetical protein Hypma_000251 [Hypsizygus marmoreus]|uniref:DUF6533 domain-containing protein n=1 Tax=Hypsizygus marmoreus TaxID=39966 RepID=A0A369JD19_HYPMA|nr:hypothetical protein Hypma_000251 [Hypsizygus marmoreus]
MEDVPPVLGLQIIEEARYAIVAVFCLQIYEWVTSAEKEIKLIHKARWTSIKTAYLLCRYYPLLLWPLVLFAYVGNHSWDMCNLLTTPVHIILAPLQIFPQGVMLMRAYAFSGRDRRVLFLLCSCYVGLVGVDIWVFCTDITMLPKTIYILLGGTGCYPDYGKGFMGFRLGYSMLAATLMDLVSLAVVLVICIRTRTREISLGRYFVNQGLVAFGLVSGLNIATAVIFFKPNSSHSGIGLPFTLVVSNLIACRIILELRRKVTPSDSEIAQRNSRIVRDAFAQGDSDAWLMPDEKDKRWHLRKRERGVP